MTGDERAWPGRGWHLFAVIVATVVGVAGLAVVGFWIAFLVALNSWGSNK